MLLELIFLPFSFAFDVEPPVYTVWVTTAFFVLDLLLNFRTGFYFDGTVVRRADMIVYLLSTAFKAVLTLGLKTRFVKSHEDLLFEP